MLDLCIDYKEAKLETLLSQKKEIMSSLIKNKVMVKQQVYNILNTQQKVKYDKMMNNWQKNRQQKSNNLKNAITQ
jgi:protein CpxP